MILKVSAIYENGVLRPLEPLQLDEKQEVEVSISTDPEEDEVIDTEFHENLRKMNLPDVSIEEVRRRLAKIPGSLVDDFIAEREERY